MKTLNLLLAILFIATTVLGQSKKKANTTAANQTINGISVEQLKKMCNDEGPHLIEIFKDLHANPELPFFETRTAAVVAKELKSYGFEVTENMGATGVVGIMKNGEGPVVMYRADMDCNSVEEAVDLPYKSTKRMVNAEGIEVPVMHACGHDAHVTWMLGIAKIMASIKSNWKGTLVVVGQPAEEIGFGADTMANVMFKSGVPLPTYLLGMHTGPVGVGLYSSLPGDRMAGADQIDVTFYGVGGHGSSPEHTKDPIVMAANAIIQYQTVISRNMDPQRPAVLTVGAVVAGLDNNVIPASATLKINLRWYREADHKLMVDRIKQINEGIAVANGLPKDKFPVMTFKQHLGVLANDEKLTAMLAPALEKIAGPGKNLTIPPVMASEDFQQLVKDYPNIPYSYIHVGIANNDFFKKALSEGKMFPFTNHNPDFWVDLSAIPFGTQLALAAVLEAFSK